MVQTLLLACSGLSPLLWKLEGVMGYLSSRSLAEAEDVYFLFGRKCSLRTSHFLRCHCGVYHQPLRFVICDTVMEALSSSCHFLHLQVFISSQVSDFSRVNSVPLSFFKDVQNTFCPFHTPESQSP